MISCQSKESNYKYFATIQDSVLLNTIHKYGEEMGIDNRRSYLTVEYLYSGSEMLYIISNAKSRAYRLYNPSNFSLVDDVAVVIDLDVSEFISTGNIIPELDQFFTDQGIHLADTVKAYDPPYWILSKCGNSYELTKKRDPKRVYSLPCDYLIKLDVSSDSLILIKK
jgi:hypothetical protein